MSRAFDVLLLVLIGFLAWNLLRSDSHLALAGSTAAPVTAKVRIAGDAPLDGLGLLLIPGDDLLGAGGFATSGDGKRDTTPHQLAPFYRDRTTQIIVPAPGAYRVRFGVQDNGPAPRRPRDVMLELPPEAKAAEQIIEVVASSEPGTATPEIVLELSAAHAAGLQAIYRR